ncbi:hypothetical protein SLI_3562 [Streptomyces lividans 1326]|uniref:Uncharacterized protein n=1 Tax=Streptomyces lividans 1326 TaxID=1200984 RepID=A0A7U9DTR9_STRLI|nr:hypothetical protein SLI_3562 [Streptomyces lividans 1326]
MGGRALERPIVGFSPVAADRGTGRGPGVTQVTGKFFGSGK